MFTLARVHILCSKIEGLRKLLGSVSLSAGLATVKSHIVRETQMRKPRLKR